MFLLLAAPTFSTLEIGQANHGLPSQKERR